MKKFLAQLRVKGNIMPENIFVMAIAQVATKALEKDEHWKVWFKQFGPFTLSVRFKDGEPHVES